MQQLWRDG